MKEKILVAIDGFALGILVEFYDIFGKSGMFCKFDPNVYNKGSCSDEGRRALHEGVFPDGMTSKEFFIEDGWIQKGGSEG